VDELEHRRRPLPPPSPATPAWLVPLMNLRLIQKIAICVFVFKISPKGFSHICIEFGQLFFNWFIKHIMQRAMKIKTLSVSNINFLLLKPSHAKTKCISRLEFGTGKLIEENQNFTIFS
jgi:hypothetical protein